MAQQAPTPALPNSGLPTREEVTPPPAPSAPDKPRLKVEGDIERSACALSDPAYKDVRITLSGATFNNLGPVSPAELAPVYQAYLGKDVSASAICEIRDAAATKLRQMGYLAAVQVPTQKIEDGVVRFEVLYARVVAVRVRGDAGKAETLIASYLGKLTRDPVFNRNSAERYLLLARDLPGYDVRLALKPTGAAPGELIGDITVVRRPADIDANIQNYASRATGRFGGQIRGQFYGLTGLGDRTSVALYSTADFKEQQILQLGHDMRVGGEGLTLSGRFTYAWTKPEIAATTGVVKARTLFGTAEASYPFLRSQRANLTFAGGLDIVNQTVRFGGTPISRDRLRVAYLRVDGDVVDLNRAAAPAWRLAYTAELRQGLDIFSAREGFSGGVGSSRSDGDAESTSLRLSGLAEWTPGSNVTISLAPRAQYAFDPLMSFEEFSAGTYTIGRGYDPGTLIGDHGIGGTLEVRVNRLRPFTQLDATFQPFVFVDSAWIWNKNAGIGAQRLTSVGGGVRASLSGHMRLDATLAVPTKRAGLQPDRGDVRFLVSLTTKLFPWKAR
ncbi:ShlB/FhaC/HecB family hemolysin secretion/activation protein [Sphingomonas crocodyli]|uniref:ShlB/FhaC/HecB family hemolysin secretion/activation protein n=1 Tax=Sphingomonas crocodyli TaxID=1979270 RepID=UPI001F0C72CB|nr:ShlB/FhaC/HecB family hemolysin secretion/activation protein [Sphingomonas crocodyli]